MADDSEVRVDVSVLLKHLDRVEKLKRELQSLAKIKVGVAAKSGPAERTFLFTQKLSVQTQELTNRQERARQATERLALSQRRLEQAHERAAAGAGKTASAHADLDRTLGKVGGSLRNLGLGLTSLGSALSIGLTAPLAAIGVVSLQSAVSMDSLRLGLKAVTGSAAEAEVQLARLTEIARLPGIGFAEAIQGSIRLQALGIEAAVAERSLRAFSNAVALTGGGRENLDRLLVQLTQLLSKGKVLQQDLRFIIENAPATGKALRAAFGTVNPEEIEALGLSTDQFLDRLLTGLEGLPKAAAGARNTLDNFADSVFRVSSALGDAILPVLTNIIETAEPILVRLADAFRALPAPVQTLVVLMGTLAAATGPALFVLGQFSTGIGGLVSAFGRLHALGIVPTIAGFRLLGQVMAGTASLAAGASATAAASAAGWAALSGAILGIVAVVGLVGYAIYQATKSQKESLSVTADQIRAGDAQIASYQSQLSFLNKLKGGVAETEAEQEQLRKTYESLNEEARARAETIDKERGGLVGLREELQKLIFLRNEERRQQAATLAASLADTLKQAAETEAAIARTTARINQLSLARQSLQQSGGTLSREQTEALQFPDLIDRTAAEQLELLATRLQILVERQKELRGEADRLNGTAREQSAALAQLEQRTGLTARQLLEAAQGMGLFKGDIDRTLSSVENFRRKEGETVEATDELTSALDRQARMYRDLANAIDKHENKQDAALKGLEAFLATYAKTAADIPRLTRDFFKVSPDAKGAVEEIKRIKAIRDAARKFLGLDRGRGDRGLASELDAERDFQRAKAELTEAGLLKEEELERQKLEKSLAENELNHELNLRSFHAFLRERQRLLNAQIDLEIQAERRRRDRARAVAERAGADAADPRLGTSARTRARVEQQNALKEVVESETAILELQERQRENQRRSASESSQFTKRRREEIRDLSIQLDELRGKELEASRDEIDARFAEQVKALENEMAFAEAERARARAAGDLARAVLAQKAIDEIAAQAQVVESVKDRLKALGAVEVIQRQIGRATEAQRNEQDEINRLAEFEGRTIEQTLQARLQSEAKLRDTLVLTKVELEKIAKTAPSPDLLNFIAELAVRIKSLGKVSFKEQLDLLAGRFSREQTKFDLASADVQSRLAQGLILERGARRELNALQREYAARQLVILETALATAEAAKDETKALEIRSQIQDVKELGRVADEEGQRINRTISDGLVDVLASARKGIDGVKDAITDLGNHILDTLTRIAAESLVEEIFGSILKPDSGNTEGTIGGFFSRLLGVNPKEDANTTATEENTEAINGLTAAMGGEVTAGDVIGQAKRDPLGFVGRAAGFVGGLFGKDKEEGEEGQGGGGFLGFLAGLSGTAEGAAQKGSTVIDALNINSDETKKNTEALKRNTEAQGGGEESAAGFVGALGSLFGGAGAEGGFASGGQVPIRVSTGERFYPPAEVRRIGLARLHAANARLQLNNRVADIRGPGTRTSDSIPALAPPGSFILNADAVEADILGSINSGRGRFNMGGVVDGLPASSFASGGGQIDLKQVLVDKRSRFLEEMTSAEGRRILADVIGEEAPAIRRRIGLN